MSRDTARCGHCDGTGRRPLTEALQDTLDYLRSACETLDEIAAKELAGILDVGYQTAIWRLEELRAEGLVERRRAGRSYLWRPV